MTTSEEQTCRPAATARKARTTDPATSKRAALAAAPRAGSQRARVLAAILVASNGLTYDQVAEATGIVGVSVSTRISELVAAGLVERRGERPTSAGGSAAICFATDLARGSVAA